MLLGPPGKKNASPNRDAHLPNREMLIGSPILSFPTPTKRKASPKREVSICTQCSPITLLDRSPIILPNKLSPKGEIVIGSPKNEILVSSPKAEVYTDSPKGEILIGSPKVDELITSSKKSGSPKEEMLFPCKENKPKEDVLVDSGKKSPFKDDFVDSIKQNSFNDDIPVDSGKQNPFIVSCEEIPVEEFCPCEQDTCKDEIPNESKKVFLGSYYFSSPVDLPFMDTLQDIQRTPLGVVQGKVTRVTKEEFEDSFIKESNDVSSEAKNSQSDDTQKNSRPGDIQTGEKAVDKQGKGVEAVGNNTVDMKQEYGMPQSTVLNDSTICQLNSLKTDLTLAETRLPIGVKLERAESALCRATPSKELELGEVVINEEKHSVGLELGEVEKEKHKYGVERKSSESTFIGVFEVQEEEPNALEATSFHEV